MPFAGLIPLFQGFSLQVWMLRGTRLDLVSPPASWCLQKTVSANLPPREDGGKRRKMGNVEATIQLLKENCQVLLFEKNLLKKKITIPSSLCAQLGVCCFEIGL